MTKSPQLDWCRKLQKLTNVVQDSLDVDDMTTWEMFVDRQQEENEGKPLLSSELFMSVVRYKAGKGLLAGTPGPR